MPLLAHAVTQCYQVALPELSRNEHGKPYFTHHPDWHFNLSHTRDYIACALGSAPVGVDIQVLRSPSAALVSRVCSAPEQAWLNKQPCTAQGFTALWALKESYVKYTGEGIGNGKKLATLDLPLPNGNQMVQSMPHLEVNFHLWQTPMYALAVCSKSTTIPQISWVNNI